MTRVRYDTIVVLLILVVALPASFVTGPCLARNAIAHEARTTCFEEIVEKILNERIVIPRLDNDLRIMKVSYDSLWIFMEALNAVDWRFIERMHSLYAVQQDEFETTDEFTQRKLNIRARILRDIYSIVNELASAEISPYKGGVSFYTSTKLEPNSFTYQADGEYMTIKTPPVPICFGHSKEAEKRDPFRRFYKTRGPEYAGYHFSSDSDFFENVVGSKKIKRRGEIHLKMFGKSLPRPAARKFKESVQRSEITIDIYFNIAYKRSPYYDIFSDAAFDPSPDMVQITPNDIELYADIYQVEFRSTDGDLLFSWVAGHADRYDSSGQSWLALEINNSDFFGFATNPLKKMLIGKWQWEKNISEYLEGGDLSLVWTSGKRAKGTWNLLGKTLIYRYWNGRDVIQRFNVLTVTPSELRVQDPSNQNVYVGAKTVDSLSIALEKMRAKEVLAQEKRTKESFPNEFIPYDEPPLPIGGFAAIQRNLEYPEIAYNAGVEGRVIVQVLVSENGEVLQTRVIKSLGHSGCDQAAVDAIKKVKWRAALHDSKPVKVWVAIPVIFRLE